MTPSDLRLPDTGSFHHIGYATESIERELPFFARLGYLPEGDPFVDPTQGIEGLFLHGPGPRIELLENHGPAETLTPWLDKGVRMYHLAWEVEDLEGVIGIHRSWRSRVLVAPVPAVAFPGRRISFVLQRNGMLVEYIGP